ncbi:transglutaminase domain-containing protein [Flavobacterium beibuense]|uniref:Transglutaminase protein n=1 Tax=Flavobacterium beibuense TaxID=657326 RepID=A0A444WAV8_9FLAO|nr:transglutaminase domain-containing protein [Flavobacterium beibuense]RYJ42948.1 Transglutaminase protein [Flavobacterium beibuense]
MKKILIYFTLILFTLLSNAQEKKLYKFNNPYYEIDSLAVYTQYKGDIPLLVSELTKNCTTQLEKSRAIFMWITENIEYDYKAYNKGDGDMGMPEHKAGKEYGKAYAKWEDNYLKNIITKKKAICSGYSWLFKKMCDLSGIQSSVVSGYIKQKKGEIGKTGKLDHAWNVMLIDDKYYHIDATWGAGFCFKNEKGKLESFVKRRNDFYWLIPHDKLLIDHFPEDPEWIRHKPYVNAMEDYKNQPYYEKGIIPYIKIVKPESGIINARVGNVIHFKLKVVNYAGPHLVRIRNNTNRTSVLKPIESYYIDKDSNSVFYMEWKDSVDFKREVKDTTIVFDYMIRDDRIRNIEVGIDGWPTAFYFKVNIQ